MIELLTPSEMAIADRTTIEGGTPGIELMENAGCGVADVVARLVSNSARVVVLAGPGNNGGDGFVAARVLQERGFSVVVGLLGKEQNIKGDARLALEKMKIATKKLTPEIVNEGDLFIDALFGAGLCREIDGINAELIQAVNDSNKPVVAVDLPSGISGKTGDILGIACKATETITFFRKKPGHVLFPGRSYCGKVSVVDIGIPTSVFETVKPNVFCNHIEYWESHIPQFKQDGHKYHRGHVAVYSGPIQSTGAARLCAQAALRIGAGLVTLFSPSSALEVNASHLTAVMIKLCDNVEESSRLLMDTKINAVTIGPGFGIGERTQDFVSSILATPLPVVLDADSLTSYSEAPDNLFAQIKKLTAREVVLTPHEGEFDRLFGKLVTGKSKIEKTRLAAKISQAIVVLKGADTVIASPKGVCVINENAPPWLATAGAGDVLAGIICGLIAQSVPAFYASCMGVWIHGEVAKRLGPGITSEDLIMGMQSVVKELVQ